MTHISHLLSSIITATEKICALPAIPTQDWATQAATALAAISDTGTVGIMIANIDQSKSSLKPICTGIGNNFTEQTAHTSNANEATKSQALYLRDKLDRVTSLGFKLPENTVTRGLVAPFSQLHPQPHTTPIGRIFAAQHLQNLTLAFVPISQKHPGFMMICILAQNSVSSSQSQQPSPQNSSTTETLAQLLPILSRKAEIALEHVHNPKAWLTDREHEILEQLILGHSVRVIAEHLGRSAHTVHDHVKNLHKKLNASSRGELIAKALGHTPQPLNSQPQAPDPIVLNESTQLSEIKPTQSVLHSKAHRLTNDS